MVAFPPVLLANSGIISPEMRRAKAALVIANPKAKLMDQVHEVLRVKHYALRTEQSYCEWVMRFLKFHRDRTGGWKHPREMGGAEIGAFLTHLAAGKDVAVATQNQALNALVFLYEAVLRQELGPVGEFLRASRPRKVPVVLSREEVKRLLAALKRVSPAVPHVSHVRRVRTFRSWKRSPALRGQARHTAGEQDESLWDCLRAWPPAGAGAGLLASLSWGRGNEGEGGRSHTSV